MLYLWDEPVEAHWLSATGWHRGGLQATLPEALWRLASSESMPCSSVPPDFLLQWLWPPTADLIPPCCPRQWQRLGFHPSATGRLKEAYLL